MLRRRGVWGATAALAFSCWAPLAHAQARNREALRVGADPMAESLARALLAGFGGYGGIASKLEIAPSAPTLDAIEHGELDVALTLAPEAEARLVQQGLAHDRHLLGHIELLLVGPTNVGVARGADAAEAMRKIAADGIRFIGRTDGSGLQMAELALWRAAGVAPAPPWYLPADSAPLPQARAYRAALLVERSGWVGGAVRDAFGVLADNDVRLRAPVHVLRPFRSSHPAGKLFIAWVTGPQGRKIVAGAAGVRAARDDKPAGKPASKPAAKPPAKPAAKPAAKR